MEYGKVKRKVKRIGIFSIVFTCLILIIAMVGNTGVVRAEEEKVVEYGERSVRLRPEFESVTYLIDEFVLHAQQFDEVGRWDTEGEVIQSHLNLTSGKTASVDGTDEDVNINHTEGARYGMRYTGEFETGDELLNISGDGGYISVETSDGDGNITVYYGDSSELLTDEGVGEEDYLRIVVSVGDGEFSVGVYDDAYTELDSEEELTTDLTSEDVDYVELGEVGDYVKYSHFYVSSDTADMNGISDPNGMDEDMWSPDEGFDERMNINYDDANVVANTTSDVMWDSARIDDTNISDIGETNGLMHGSQAIDYSIQTGDDYGEFGERASHFQGWDNIRDTIESNLVEHIAEAEGVVPERVALVDYILEDMNLVSRFEEGYIEEVQHAYAESVLRNVDERDWYMVFPETLEYLGEEDYEDAWLEPGEVKNDGLLIMTVDEMVETTCLERRMINGVMRYGTESQLDRLEDFFTQTTYSINGVGVDSGIVEGHEYIPDWANPTERQFWIGGIAEEAYGIAQDGVDFNLLPDYSDEIPTMEDFADTIERFALDPQEDLQPLIDNQQEFMHDVLHDTRDMALSSMEIYGESVEDIRAMHETTVSEFRGMFDDSINQMTQVNMEMANMFEGTVSDLSDNMLLQQEQDNEMMMSMMRMHESTLEEFGDISDDIVNAFDYDLENELVNPKPADGGFSVQHTNPIVTITVIIIVVMVVLIAVGMAVMWKNQNEDKQGGSKRTDRR